MKGIFAFFLGMIICLSLYAENCYIAAVPYIKSVGAEESAEIIGDFINSYNETVSYKLMAWAEMEHMLSRSLLERTIFLEDTAYCLAIARQLDVQYLLSVDFEKSDTVNLVLIKIFDLKAQTFIHSYSNAGIKTPYALLLAMISNITPGIDEILSNDRVVLSLIEQEKNRGLNQKPALQAEQNLTADSVSSLPRKERKKIREMEKFKQEQQKIIAVTEKKREKALKTFSLTNGAVEEQQEAVYPMDTTTHTASLNKENNPVINAAAPPAEIPRNKQEEAPAEKPETITIPDTTGPDTSRFTPAALTQTPDSHPPAPAQKPSGLNEKEAAAMVRAEKKRFKDTQKLKRAETSAMAKAEKKRKRY